MAELMTVDITDDAITAAVIANLPHSNGKAILGAFKTEALRLDFRFAKRWYRAPAPDVAMQVLGRAVEAVESEAIGYLLAKEIVDALEYERVYMHMGPSTAALLAEEQRRHVTAAGDIPTIDSSAATEVSGSFSGAISPAHASVLLTVDVVGDQVIVSGVQQFATFNWKAASWGNEVKHLSVQAERRPAGLEAQLAYRVIAGDIHGSGNTASVVAENLSETDAQDLIWRIQDGVKVSLGIGIAPDNVVQLDEPTHVAAAAEPPRTPMIVAALKVVVDAVSEGVRISFYVCVVLAALMAAVVLLPIAYRIGHHLSAHLLDLAFDVYPALQELLS
ncbi:hypothetical protein VL15_15070 [Burkholderia cepacia]|uniref:Uncharacterized protein n=1 Tax=Burkholderia cepacia TaxID=292 RepID=A0A0J5WYX9_BURCE|nr:hypothetical protein [Burkholderia cepacia]KML57043.1 hypothetical protein VL15_15070 [Burkholderia cepacia]